MHTGARRVARIENLAGRSSEGINLASQDYLGLATSPRMVGGGRRGRPAPTASTAAARGPVRGLGWSRASSRGRARRPGRAEHVTAVPDRLGGRLRRGRRAGAAVRPHPDRPAGPLLPAAGRAGGHPNVVRYEHLRRRGGPAAPDRDPGHRHPQRHPGGHRRAFSVDADWPDLVTLQRSAGNTTPCCSSTWRTTWARGAGRHGRAGEQGLLGEVDIVMGAFSKTFCSNGGFVASRSPA